MRMLFVLWAVATLCLAAACTSDRHPRGDAADGPVTPDDLLVVVGQQAGPAGRVRGYSIRADGRVRQWEGKYVEENVLAEGVVPSDVVDSLWHRVQANDFFAQQQQVLEERAFMSVTARGDTRRVSWEAVPADSSEAPLGQLYVSYQAAARAAVQQAPGTP